MDNPSSSHQSEGQPNQQSLTKIAPDVSVLPPSQMSESAPVHLDPNPKKRNSQESGHNRNATGNLRDSIEIGVEPRDQTATAVVSFKKDIGPNLGDVIDAVRDVDAPPAKDFRK